FTATHSRFRALSTSAIVEREHRIKNRADREKTMANLDRPLARRAVIKGAGLGLVAGGLADALPMQSAAAATAEGDEIWSSEYWTKKGDIPLWCIASGSARRRPASLPGPCCSSFTAPRSARGYSTSMF